MNNINTNVYLRRTIKNSTRICALIVLLLQVFYGENLKAQTCPTCTDMQTTIIDVDALPLSSDKKPLTFTGPIDKDSCKDPNVSNLKCFAFKFVRASGSTNQEFTFSAGQGASCNGELDKVYIMSGTTCTTLSSGGSQTTVTFAFPEGVNEATLFLCINSNSSVCLKDVCRPNSSNNNPKIDTPNKNSDLGCNPTVVAPEFTVSGQCKTNTNVIVVTTGVEGTGCMKTQTWKANFTDECNNVAKEKVITYTWTEDNMPPTASNPSDIMLQGCSASFPEPNTDVITDEADACGTPKVKFVSDGTPTLVGCTETMVRTYSVTDDCGNSIMVTQNLIRMIDEQAPTISGPSLLEVNSDANCNYTLASGDVTAVDNCGEVKSMTYVDTPNGCYSTPKGGNVNANGSYFPIEVMGLDMANQLQKIDISFYTNKGKGRVEIILIAPNGTQGIVLVGPYCTGDQCDIEGTYSPSFYPASSSYPVWNNSNAIPTGAGNFEPFGGPANEPLPGITMVNSFEEFTGSGTGQWQLYARKNQSENGSVKLNIGCLSFMQECVKTFNRTYTAMDACNNVSTFVQTIIVKDNLPPIIECPENMVLEATEDDCKFIGAFDIKVTDNCSSASEIVVSYTLSGATTSTPNQYTTLDGVLFNQGITIVTVTATDKCGNVTTAPCEFELSCEGVFVQPVTLVSFDGKVTKEGNELNWKTSDEVNFSHFEIERSTNAKVFEFISKINGFSNSKEMKSFNYLDKSNGLNYYRLKMVDIDGKFKYSKVIFLSSENQKSLVGEFYPNPTIGGQTFININSNESASWTITSYDISGKVLKTETRLLNKGENKVSIAAYKDGNIQIFRFENSDSIQYRKLLK